MDYTQLAADLKHYIDQFKSGELATLMVSITALSGTFFFLKNLISRPINRFISFVRQWFYHDITFYNSENKFGHMTRWLEENKKHVWFQRSYRVDNYGDLSPGYGSIWVKVPGSPLLKVSRGKEESNQTFEIKEFIIVRVYGFRKARISELIERVCRTELPVGPFIHSMGSGYLTQGPKPKRVLPPLGESAADFLNDVEYFLENEDFYVERGIPYKRGYLLYGVPGTGKTSLIAHLSHKHKLDIFEISALNSKSLIDELSTKESPSIVVIEDIDLTAVGQGRNLSEVTDSKDDSKPARGELIRDLLNSLDGLRECHGFIFVCTTNKPDVLDPALLRPGRIDRRIEIGCLSHEEQIQHINRFYKSELSASDYISMEPRTVADLQNLCVQNLRNLEGAIDACGLVKKGTSRASSKVDRCLKVG